MIDTKEQLHQRLKDIKTQLRLSMNGVVSQRKKLWLAFGLLVFAGAITSVLGSHGGRVLDLVTYTVGNRLFHLFRENK